MSPDRHRSLTNRTLYASLCKDGRPSELDTGTNANNRQAEQVLDQNHKTLSSIHRKSITQINAQRKLLEKSMLAYSDKMKEISNERTSDLFREIHTRNSIRPTKGTKSLTLSVDSSETKISSVDLFEKRRLLRPRASLCEVSKVDMSLLEQRRKLSLDEVKFTHLRRLLRRSSTIGDIGMSPLPEEEYSTPSTQSRSSPYRSADSMPTSARAFVSVKNSPRGSAVQDKDNNFTGMILKQIETNAISPVSSASVKRSSKPEHTYGEDNKCPEIMFTTPRIHISKKEASKLEADQSMESAQDNKTREYESSDSAYSSCGEDEVDEGYDGVANDMSSRGFLLTVPRVHTRRNTIRKSKSPASKKVSLHRKVVLRNVSQGV